MKFINDEHRDFYQKCIEQTNSTRDPYRRALFYTLGLYEKTRCNIVSLYDFANEGISYEGLNAPWQTSSTMQATRLAFNLYNGFMGNIGDTSIDNPSRYTPYHLFDTSLMPYFLEAINLRYPQRDGYLMNEDEDMEIDR